MGWIGRIGMGVITLIVGTTLVAVSAPAPAAALDGTEFNPGYIISDAQFYDGDALSESQIQAFLYAFGPASCNTPAHPGYTCLYDLSFPTFTKIANPMCAQYTGAASETVARIISKVSAACGISPKVLLVMLQKEQGLITDTWPTTGQLATAMGAGCPDTAACDPAQKGFFQQVYLAAYYMIRYGMPPGTGPGTPYTTNYGSRYPLGLPSDVLYQANSPGCGARSVVVSNQPTASLYWYTPYTPNAAALANLYGLGDACSAYGNRNFWVYFNNWFGDPTIGLAGVTVARISGATRYDVAVKISQQGFATTGVPVVYVTNGDNFPDALSASPAASVQGGPLLLTTSAMLPTVVRAEISRLRPARIVVVGGARSVSDSVFAELSALAPAGNTIRIGGADRYEASRNVAQYAFGTLNPATAYVATGENYPDALSASAAAGSSGSPVILIPGSSPMADQPTLDLIVALRVTRLKIAGGPNSVSQAQMDQLGAVVPAVRLSGTDRVDASRNIVRDAFAGTRPTEIFLATGYNFPDALAGAALAGKKRAPLLLVPGFCVPQATIDMIRNFGSTSVTLLGGPDSLSPSVRYFTPC